MLTEIQNLSPQGGIHPQEPTSGAQASHTGGVKDGTGKTAFAFLTFASRMQAECRKVPVHLALKYVQCLGTSNQTCGFTRYLCVSESHGWGTDDDSSIGQDSGAQTPEDNNEALKTLEREVGPQSLRLKLSKQSTCHTHHRSQIMQRTIFVADARS